MQEEKNNLPETSKDGGKHSTPRPPEIVAFPRCNNVGIEWYGRMPADPPLVNPKDEKLLGPSEQEGATPEATDPKTDNWPPH